MSEKDKEIKRLRNELQQCALELLEASNLLWPHYKRLSGIYEAAAVRAQNVLRKAGAQL